MKASPTIWFYQTKPVKIRVGRHLLDYLAQSYYPWQQAPRVVNLYQVADNMCQYLGYKARQVLPTRRRFREVLFLEVV